jgi:hypothetical protein
MSGASTRHQLDNQLASLDSHTRKRYPLRSPVCDGEGFANPPCPRQILSSTLRDQGGSENLFPELPLGLSGKAGPSSVRPAPPKPSAWSNPAIC